MSGGRAETGGAPQALGYPVAMQVTHWSTVTLLFGVYPAAWMIGSAVSSSDVTRLVMLHRLLGVTVFLLTLLRFALRQYSRIPLLPADVPALQRFAARGTAVLLYGLLMVQPILGLMASMLHGDRIALFGGFLLPSLLPINQGLSRQIFEVHGWMALMLLALIAVHVAAALYHHFIRHDEVLAGMLPGAERLPRGVHLAPGKPPRA